MIKTLISHEYPPALIDAIRSARRTIDIVMFRWQWYADDPTLTIQQVNNEIVASVRRGVRVRSITDNLDAVPLLNSLGVAAKHYRHARVCHVKLAIIDDALVFCGSHNLSKAGFASNLELSFALDDPDTVLRLRDFFKNLYHTL